MYSETTESLKITVTSNFVGNLSSISDQNYVWSYNIILENLGNETIQLLNRYWQIIDKYGHIQKIDGPGVVGQKPILKPGESFEYSSHAQLSTSSGIMIGNYEMIYSDNGRKFMAKIPVFSLDIPDEKTVLH